MAIFLHTHECGGTWVLQCVIVRSQIKIKNGRTIPEKSISQHQHITCYHHDVSGVSFYREKKYVILAGF
ncbi:hypothetical protein PV327_008470 [Microctonus hyperodae]|uniref:Uncharacterized protein n=1 Tax=Microctonus hyperodae TaxID=165561 RepID=A0AA39F398_MICHY|nr:hypothetical protein PV327_008470 [Microctonus hyperodae]